MTRFASISPKPTQLVTPKTRAIIVMDYDCILCDHDAVGDFAGRHGVRVLHDAAHSFGSRYHGRMIGSFSDMAMFSFDPVKTITCIDGGALVVRTEEELNGIHEMRLIGMSQPSTVMYQNQRAWTYDVQRIGFRYHMANLHAAIGLAQLSKIDTIARRAETRAGPTTSGSGGCRRSSMPNTNFDDITPFLYYIRVPAGEREGLRAHLKQRGVDTGIHWQPGHWFTLLRNCRRSDMSVTDRVGKEILSLPLHSCMSAADSAPPSRPSPPTGTEMTSSIPGRDVVRILKLTAGAPGAVLCIGGRLAAARVARAGCDTAGSAAERRRAETDRLEEPVRLGVPDGLHRHDRPHRRMAHGRRRPNEGKILFMVDTPEGSTFGYMGLDFIDWTALAGEADAVVRGGEAPAGVMTEALRTLMAWARGHLGLRELAVRVRSDNTALEFYRKAGFREVRRVALRRVVEPDGVSLIEDCSAAAAEPSLVHLRDEA